MSAPALSEAQRAMASFLRNPDTVPPPDNVEPRRLKIYQDLIYNNIEGFISGGFPVLRSLYEDQPWHALVRQFIDGHRCHSPYFLEISQEFIGFLMNEYSPGENDPVFIAELAHYEWVELALDVSEETLPKCRVEVDALTLVPALSPLAWLLSYAYPVHRIGPAFIPGEAGEATYLVVYRDAADTVQFMELNAASARLLELIRENAGSTGQLLLNQLADELGQDREVISNFGVSLIDQFVALSIVTECQN